ncbi:hypothetical protein [Thiohalomonas denitrificans]|uniref:Uncharacterized protein n=1 Tax=Thiohalomonas denitrificans TaxID=415747 RepID=A0A1G5PSY4_9GAMM|nr:hypothetical protein [Thiohalomonas denitrificans]SCZ52301.1 hypothetical protein SAMN03097708_00721 [Thiohalomonas denitrificans]
MASSNFEITLSRFRALDGKELEVVGFAERASEERPEYVVARHRDNKRRIGVYEDRTEAVDALTSDFGPLRQFA